MADSEPITAHPGARRRPVGLLVLLVAFLLTGCGVGTPAHVDLYATPTPGPQSQFLTYLGEDGNVWQLSLPEGSAVQLTSDASPGMIVYSGLAWSPDGKYLAVLRIARSSHIMMPELILLRPSGQVVMQAPLLDVPYGHPFAWAPDSRYIAYRVLASRSSSSQALLVVLDAHSGALHKALTYPFQQGCRRARTALRSAIDQIHQTAGGIDTFDWTPDGRSILASASCAGESSLRIEISSGSVIPGYPLGASFQPRGTLILGVWNANSALPVLGVADGTSLLIRDLAPESVASPGLYPVLAGEATWAANGRDVYFEHTDGIWHVNADGSGAKAIVAGTALDNHRTAIVALAPAISPDNRMLAYCELYGQDTGGEAVTRTWYVAGSDGSNPAVLPDITSEAIWQPHN